MPVCMLGVVVFGPAGEVLVFTGRAVVLAGVGAGGRAEILLLATGPAVGEASPGGPVGESSPVGVGVLAVWAK